MSGLKWQAIIKGLAFMSHQVGSFLAPSAAGVLCDALGSTMAWRIGVAFALTRPSQPPVLRTA